MIGTILGLIAALFFMVMMPASGLQIDVFAVSFVFVVAATFFLGITFSAKARAWANLARAEMEIFPRAQELFLKDKLLPLCFLILFAFVLFSYTSVFFVLIGLSPFVLSKLLILWIFLFGITFDVIRFQIRRMMSYSDGLFLLMRIKSEFVKDIEKGKDQEAFDLVDTLVDVLGKSVRTASTYVAVHTLNEMLLVIESYVGATGIYLRGRPEEASKTSLLDRTSYFCAYVSKRLEWVFHFALTEKMEPIAEEIIVIFGKFSLYFVKYHPSLSHLPLLFIERFAKFAIDKGNDEVAIRAQATLSELIKNYMLLAKEKGESMKEIAFNAFSHLEEIVKEMYRKNKEMNVALLMQPFAEIGQFLANPELESLIDREEILNELRRILGEFNALDTLQQREVRA